MVRRSIAGTLAFLGVISLNMGALGWWIDREVAEPDRISEIATAVGRSPEFQAAVAEEVTESVIDATADKAGPLADVDTATIESAIAEIMADDEVVATLKGAIVDLYNAAMEVDITEVNLDLGPIQDALVSTLGPIDPELAGEVEQAQLGETEITVDANELPDLGTITDHLHLAWMLQIGFGLAATSLALLIHPRRFVMVRRIGVLMGLGAGVQLLIAWGLVRGMESFGPDERLFVGVTIAAEMLMDSLRIQAYLQLTVAIGVTVVGHGLIWAKRLTPSLVPRLA
ncbi:MAG: hypothetical protein GY708_22310 [Actinomycetia bacterium]|nr:hypothetical protein [Actinomycetes bacterium]MCP4959735.1 hypothetical protein [Actinomycetes bacterium]